MKELFLSGWGFSSAIWEFYITRNPNRVFIDLPNFENQNEVQVLDALQQQITENSIVHAWSASGLLIIKLLEQRRIQAKKIYLYAPPLRLNFINDAAEKFFVKEYEKNPKSLTEKFLKLVAYPAQHDLVEEIVLYCELNNPAKQQHYLNYLNWMIQFRMPSNELIGILNETDCEIIVGANDVVIDTTILHQFSKIKMVPNRGHFIIMEAIDRMTDKFLI